MEALKKELWVENNQLNTSNLSFINTLAKQKKLTMQETIHHGFNALFIKSGLETYKVVVNTDECKLNVLGKNKVGSDNHYHHVRDFEGTDAWYEAIHFIGELIRSKRGDYLCLGKRFYKKSYGYG